MGLPILLVFVGGVLGALVGISASYAGARVFRSGRGLGAKYLLSGAISLGAVAIYVGGVTALQLLILWSTDPASKKALDMVAEASNRELPIMVDEQTELFELQGLEGVLVYRSRLTQVAPGQISAEELTQSLRQWVTGNACRDEESRSRFLDQGVTLRYAYTDAEGGAIGHFDVAHDDCL
jgi:hypothetical protein